LRSCPGFGVREAIRGSFFWSKLQKIQIDYLLDILRGNAPISITVGIIII
jgi:hypothetical protein